MIQFTQPFRNRVAGVVKASWQGLNALLFILPFTAPAHAQSNLQTKDGAQQPVCRPLPISMSTKDKSTEKSNALAKVLEDFEASFLLADGDLFATTVSPALLKKKEDSLKIFQGTLLEYDLRRVKLQRNWIWEMDLGTSPEPGRIVSCGDLGIQPVYGPLKQFAVQYSAFTGSNQSRLLVLFAKTSAAGENGKTIEDQRPGVVYLQVQRWTYDGRSPDQLLNESRKTASAGEPLAGALLAEAAARVMEINPYVITPQLKTARELANQLSQAAQNAQAKLLSQVQINADWKNEKFVPVFRDGSLAVGIKTKMQRDMALNDQTQRCQETGRKYFSKGSVWREHFAGFECMPYGLNEDLNKPPRGGSQFFKWSSLDSQAH